MASSTWQPFAGLQSKWRASARFRHTVGLCLVIVLIMGIGSGLLIYQTGTMIRESAEDRGLALTRAFAVTGATAVLGNLFVIQEAIQRSFDDPDVLHIDVIDSDNMIVASKHVERIGTVLGHDGWLGPVKPQEEVLIYHEDAEGQPILVIVEPLFADGRLAAWLRVVMSLAQVRAHEWQTVGRMLFVTLALMAAGVVGVHLVERHVSTVLRGLIGQLKGALSSLSGSPEPGSAESTATGMSQPRPGAGEIEHLTDVAAQTAELMQVQSEALRKSESKFRSVAQSANDAIVSADCHGNIVSWNRGAEKIFGYTEAEALGKPVTLLMPDKYRELCQSGQGRARSHEKPEVIGTTRELRGERKDGSEFPLELSLATWEMGEQRYFTAIMRDVTERKRVEDSLRESEERLALAVHGSSDGLWDARALPGEPWDAPQTPVWWSPRFVEMLGFLPEEFAPVLESWTTRIHPEDKPHVFGALAAHIERKGPYDVEYRLMTKQGDYRWFSARGQAVWDEGGNLVRMAGSLRDITERKQAQDALEALTVSLEQKVKARTAELEMTRDQALTATQHKSEFLASMSHELRTPLNAVIGFSEVLLEKMFGDLNAKQDEYLNDILSSGRHLLALINDILDLAKIEAGRTDLEFTTFNLGTTLLNTLALVRERAMRHRLEVSSEIDSRLDECLADERKIKQVVLNLLANAIKFTPEGGRISLRASVRGDCAEVSVSDTGVGIAPEDQPKIFEEFYRVKGELIRTREGTGLGLALAKKFVELHGGQIWLESQVGRGSTFTFTLPMGQGAGHETAATPATLQIPRHKPLALVVEDEPAAAKLLSIYLEEGGFGVEIANSAEVGLKKTKALRPSVITLDILMKGIDGWDFLARVKADRATAQIPVVIVSIVDDRGKGFALGADEYLVKPVEREDMISAIRRVTRDAVSGHRGGTILTIDDDPMALELMQALLEPEGFTVLKAGDGRLGIRLAREHHPSLIILDLLMPDIDGFQVLDELKRDPLTEVIPIVVLTCKTLSPDEKKALNGRISDLVQKGQFSSGDFVAQIRSLVW